MQISFKSQTSCYGKAKAPGRKRPLEEGPATALDAQPRRGAWRKTGQERIGRQTWRLATAARAGVAAKAQKYTRQLNRGISRRARLMPSFTKVTRRASRSAPLSGRPAPLLANGSDSSSVGAGGSWNVHDVTRRKLDRRLQIPRVDPRTSLLRRRRPASASAPAPGERIQRPTDSTPKHLTDAGSGHLGSN